MPHPKKVFAYCDQAGLIQFGIELPRLRMPIALGNEADVREKIALTATCNNDKHYVPDMSDAYAQGNSAEAYRALARYIQHLDKYSGQGLRAIGA